MFTFYFLQESVPVRKRGLMAFGTIIAYVFRKTEEKEFGMLQSILSGTQRNQALAKTLDARMARQRVIATNIANINTPGFHRKEVLFEDALSAAIDRSRLRGAKTNGAHLPIGRTAMGDVRHQVITPIDHTLPSGVNNVDIDHEMAQLAENQIAYNHALRFMRTAFERINSAVQLQSIRS